MRVVGTCPPDPWTLVPVPLTLLFVISLRRKPTRYTGGGTLLTIDLNMSHALKGIACIFILLGHYGQRKSGFMPDAGFISKGVWLMTANVGLVWFMFFSGYGLSLKHMDINEILGKWIKRLKKVYIPLFFICIVSTLIYALLPVKFDEATSKALWIVPEIAAIHSGQWTTWLTSVFGWLDWYVFCIMIFYTLFYLSYFIMKKTHWNQTIILSLMMIFYFVWAYNVFGPEKAQWYRYIWTFMLGHIIARAKESNKWLALSIIPFVALIFIEDKIVIIGYVLAIAALIISSLLNRYYDVKEKSAIMFLGGISYFYYLCHLRIGYQLVTYMGINDLIFWALFTTLIAWLLKLLYVRIESISIH